MSQRDSNQTKAQKMPNATNHGSLTQRESSVPGGRLQLASKPLMFQ